MTSDAKTEVIETDLLVIGGGTGGPMAAIKAKEKNPAAAGRSHGEGERQAQRRYLHGHGRAEQRRHSRATPRRSNT